MKNQKYYRVILNKKQKDVVINALSRLKYVLPEDADYRRYGPAAAWPPSTESRS